MKKHAPEVLRYIVNGLVATAVSYGVFHTNLTLFHMQSAGIANFIATCFGIVVSFLGSRYFVFRGHSGSSGSQAAKFLAFYGMLAVMQGAVLAVWTDWLHLDPNVGFVLATILQVSCSYFGNKFLVFRT
jgi:putative flippase GtrA